MVIKDKIKFLYMEKKLNRDHTVYIYMQPKNGDSYSMLLNTI